MFSKVEFSLIIYFFIFLFFYFFLGGEGVKCIMVVQEDDISFLRFPQMDIQKPGHPTSLCSMNDALALSTSSGISGSETDDSLPLSQIYLFNYSI